MNKYYRIVREVKYKIESYLNTIYQVSGDELLLELEHYNLLTDENNCIETSTATGFLMEEYITSKLSIYTSGFKDDKNEVIIKKLPPNISTVDSSYDCYAYYKNILFLFNIKVQKETSANNAIAGINILYNDYVINNPNQEKSYIILKTYYKYDKSKIDGERKIQVYQTESYALEEVDFSNGHLQDNRNWSAKFNKNSGRLQIPKKWYEKNKLDIEEISYNKTKQFIADIFNGKK